MRDALVFNGASNLDFQDIRTNVIRIPEVVMRIREAQSIWDKISQMPLDLANFIGSEDGVFLSHIKLKSFATAVVQVGLLDRYLKSHKMPEFVVGAINGDSPMKVAMGHMSFFGLVSESLAVNTAKPRTPVANALDLPILAGVQLVEYAVFCRNAEGEYLRQNSEVREVERMIVELVDQHDVNRLVMVGPGSSVSGKKILDLTSRDVQVLESIDLDPMLSWFWSNLKENRLAIAN
ncbi:MAG: hypothetical protein HC883_04560 [Bdellovibrionaceae bacterium]|nr:hypothetical protein [Pseudobdellovibrionaceae bacterium]